VRVGVALDSLGITRALFIAQSSGASIAFRLAIARPELVRGLLAIDGGPSESAATPGMKKAFKLGGFAVKLALDESKLRHDVRRNRKELASTWVTDADRAHRGAAAACIIIGAFQQMSKAKKEES
jgi:pimeloyl-ACP methyl ester carboxylesterase